MAQEQFNCIQNCIFADLSGPSCESRAKALFAAVEKGYVEGDRFNEGGVVNQDVFNGSECPTAALSPLHTNISHALLNKAAVMEGVVNA